MTVKREMHEKVLLYEDSRALGEGEWRFMMKNKVVAILVG
jgi:hypothetical protein